MRALARALMAVALVGCGSNRAVDAQSSDAPRSPDADVLVPFDGVPTDEVAPNGDVSGNDDTSVDGDDASPTPDAATDVVIVPPSDGGAVFRGVDCSGGGQVAGSGGTEGPAGTAIVGLCRVAMGCASTWRPVAPPTDPGTSGSPNHKLLQRIWNYGWAQRTSTGVDAARALLVAFFDGQLTAGHYALGNANEVLTTSHYEIWSNGMTCARVLALRYADAALLAATRRWWRGEIALLNVLQRGGSIDAPGARFPAGATATTGLGPSQLRDVIYALVMGLALPGRAAMPRAAWWDDYYNVSAWTLRNLQRAGDDLGGARAATDADLPLLADDLYVRTRGSDFVFAFNRMRGALNPLFWVARIGGATSYGPVMAGTTTDSPVPPPSLPGATERIIAGRP